MVGPRQCGKTTLARVVAEALGASFYDLEDPADQLVLADPVAAFGAFGGALVVLDEAQRMPELFPILRVLIDKDRRPGRFLLLGSATPDLRRQSAESLAGRLVTLELTPLLATELPTDKIPRDTFWLRGGLPPSLLASSGGASMRWRRQYVQDITSRDLRLIGFDLPPTRMNRFLQMLSHTHGHLWNASHLARSLEIGATTASRYLDAIQQTFLVRRLAPYAANLGKRLVRTPKVYIRDTGILHCLLAVNDKRQLLGHPVCGYSWEGMALEQLAAVAPDGWEPTFWRTSAGAEIDALFLRAGRPLVAVEMKSNATLPKPARGFHQGCNDLGISERWVVYPGDRVLTLANGVTAFPLLEAVNRMKELGDRG